MPQKKFLIKICNNLVLTKNYYREWLHREDWGALPPQGPLEKAEGPVSRVFLHYRSGTLPCYSTEECSATMRKIQENHFRRRMNDIAFNFLVASGGNVYEGRGYGVLPPADLRRSGPPGDRFDIAFIGDWTHESLPHVIFRGATAVMEKGMDLGFISKDWKMHAVILKKKPRAEDIIKKKTKHKANNKEMVTVVNGRLQRISKRDQLNGFD